MKRGIAAASLIVIVAGLGICCSYFVLKELLNPWDKPETADVDVGIFYYVWYDEGYGNLHWSDRIEWTVVDEPVRRYYNSCDPEIIKQHFTWFEELKIDFVIVSWWGFYNQTEEVSFINKATHQVFKVVDENTFKVKLAVMVEPFNETKNGYNFPQIYNHVYENFASKYPHLYYKYTTKPLICFWNNPNLTSVYNGNIPTDERFDVVIVGHHTYVDWVFDHITPHWTGEVPHGRVYSVCPRYDDSRLNRTQSYIIDPNYSQQVYQREWKKALDFAQKNTLDIVLINSWNEFNERSQIEPCHDATSIYADPYYLFNVTKTSIYELKGLDQQNNSGSWPEPVKFGLVILLIISTGSILLYAFRRCARQGN